ncbi:MAG: anti-sigma factor domain-containing protein [Pirellula sp.]
MNDSNKTILEDQMAGFLLGELTKEELKELQDLPETDRFIPLGELERIASTVSLLDLDTRENMPGHLRIAVIESYRTLVSEGRSAPLQTTDMKAMFLPRSFRESIAWIACLAASIIAIGLWLRPINKVETAAVSVWTRESLMANASDVLKASWSDGTTPIQEKVVGDVVWSNKQQTGFMRFIGMPVNDPSVEQYQLWIVDPSRDKEPIDGGVFDVSTTGETIIPIKAKLRVIRPTAFAVTIEKPGGVVVSTQERLPLLATLGKTVLIRHKSPR